MKKITFLLTFALIACFSISSYAQADYTLPKKDADGVFQVIANDTLASGESSSTTINLKRDGLKTVCYSIQVIGETLSGTTEGYPLIYKSNDLSNWTVIPAVAGDTVISGNLQVWKTDTDGVDFRYMKVEITNKAQAQSTKYNVYLYPYMKP